MNVSAETVIAVQQLQEPSGGFSDFPLPQPHLYSTYYNARSHSIIESELEYGRNTSQYLQDSATSSFQSSGKLKRLSYIRYGTAALTTLDGRVPNRTDVQATVLEHRQPDGSFCDIQYQNGTCATADTELRLLGTYYALESLSSIGTLESTRLNATEVWLRSIWVNDSYFQNASSYAVRQNVVRSLELLGVDVATLPGYETRRQWVKEQESVIAAQMEAGNVSVTTLNDYIYLKQAFNVASPEETQRIQEYVVSNQLPDGGFSHAGNEYSDSKGTAQALALLDSAAIQRLDTEQLTEFLRSRSLASGGFRLTEIPRPNTVATYHAVSTLALTDSSVLYEQPLKAQVRASVEQLERGRSVRPSMLYVLDRIGNRSSAKQPAKETVYANLETYFERVNLLGKPSTKDLTELYFATAMAQDYGYAVETERIRAYVERGQKRSGGYGATEATVPATYYSVGILRNVGAQPEDRQQTIAWVQQHQSDDGSYVPENVEARHGLTELQSTSMSVKTLDALGVRDVSVQTVRWIRQHEHVDGGFAATTHRRARPTLSATYWAVSTLRVLEQQPLNETG